jgi:hypothetical protein
MLRRVRDDARLSVSPAVGRRLRPRLTSFQPRTLVTDTRRVKRVILRCGAPQELVDDGSGLKLATPAGYETDGSITQLVDGLMRGKVLGWVSDEDDGTFGLGDSPATTPGPCRVILSFEDNNAPKTIRFGAEGEGGVYGLVEGVPGVFVAPLSLRALAGRIFVSHASLRVEPSRIESVRVSMGGHPIPVRDPALLRAAAGAFYADHAVSVGTSAVQPADVEIVIASSEGGPPKRITCGTRQGAFRRCASPDVKAVFEVPESAVARFLETSTDH